MIDKLLLQQQVLQQLTADWQQADQAAQEAHATATHTENIAENKYDTLGLEAAYLATGHARRAQAVQHAIAHWRQFRPEPYRAGQSIGLGALVCLLDAHAQQQLLFIGPSGGSMKLHSGQQCIQIISCETPLGKALIGQCEGDDIRMHIAHSVQHFEVLWVQ